MEGCASKYVVACEGRGDGLRGVLMTSLPGYTTKLPCVEDLSTLQKTMP